MLFLFTVTEAEPKSVSPTTRAFLDRVRRFHEEHPKEFEDLFGELMYWASSVAPSVNTSGEVITSQIEYNVEQIRKRGVEISVEEYIDDLFSPNPAGEISADIIMGRFQLG